MDDVTLRVSELFGPTWQGEGPATGQVAWFLRLGLCNLSCEWCDTPYTWDETRYDLAVEAPPVLVSKLADRLPDTGIVVITGGEPLIQHKQLGHLLARRRDLTWHLETNGTLPPPAWVHWLDQVSVSPKLSTHDPVKKRLRMDALQAWARFRDYESTRVTFKLVVQDRTDVDRAAALADELGLDRGRVMVMPEGRTPEQVINTHRLIADYALTLGLGTTTRLHTLLWGDERGH